MVHVSHLLVNIVISFPTFGLDKSLIIDIGLRTPFEILIAIHREGLISYVPMTLGLMKFELAHITTDRPRTSINLAFVQCTVMTSLNVIMKALIGIRPPLHTVGLLAIMAFIVMTSFMRTKSSQVECFAQNSRSATGKIVAHCLWSMLARVVLFSILL